MEYDHHQHSPSFSLSLKSSSSSSSSTSSSDEAFHRPARSSPSSWIRSKLAHDLPEEIKDKCATFFSKIGGKATRRSNKTSDFRYDPMSYALNFEDEAARIDDFPLRNFSARLPPSQPHKTVPAVSREIAACS